MRGKTAKKLRKMVVLMAAGKDVPMKELEWKKVQPTRFSQFAEAAICRHTENSIRGVYQQLKKFWKRTPKA